MIEYLDENLGVVKVLNVTEARANFAAVLGDGSSHYIITKNNKPLRVIINHQDYLTLKQAVEAKTGIVSSAPVFQKRSESRVRGLIEDRLSSLPRPQPTAAAAEVREDAVTSDPAAARKAAIAEALKRIENNNAVAAVAVRPVTPETPEDQDADYFSQDDIAEPQEQTSEAASAPLETQAKPTPEARDGAEIQNIMRQFIQDDKSAKPNTAAQAQAQADMTPQQLEYYKKYKKLYESFADKETVPEIVATPPAPEVVEKPAPSTEKRAAANEEPEATANYWDQNTDEEPPEQKLKSTEGGLPSLKELLKELEEERLSDEEPGKKGQGNHDIDDLINRITNDY